MCCFITAITSLQKKVRDINKKDTGGTLMSLIKIKFWKQN